jgi:metal-dependent amidase/aminoacylase/carboxypeptidase family protein
LGQGGALGLDYRLATVTHAVLGAPSFGISPALGEVWVTLRTVTDAPMAELRAAAVALARSEAETHGLQLSISYHDDFAASVNHPDAAQKIADALDHLAIPHSKGTLPERASEDFGRFGAQPGTKAAMVFLGAGLDHPALHNPDYDFPDDLIALGVGLFARITKDILG